MSGPLGSSQWMYASGEKDTLTIPYSCRFEPTDSDTLSKTFASAGSLTTWTFSCWVKRGDLGGPKTIFGANNTAGLHFNTSDKMFLWVSGSSYYIPSMQFRDPSAWYHIVLVWNTTAAEADRIMFYVNGVRLTDFDSGSAPAENATTDINNNVAHYLGDYGSGSEFMDGYLAEAHFIDGTACDADDFGKTGDYGNWLPVEYTGSHGTNGFYLDFADSAALGDDESGNTNDFTVNNLDANDQMLDTPSNNFCVMNPLDIARNDGTNDIKWGNLFLNDIGRCNATMAVSSGKWYWEARMHHQHHGGQAIGLSEVNNNIMVAPWANDGNTFEVGHPGSSGGVSASLYVDGTSTSYGGGLGSVADGQLLGFMLDADAQTITVHCDDAEIDPVLTDFDYSGADNMETVTPMFAIPGGRQAIANFGQDSSFAGAETAQGETDSNGIGDFYYEPPTDYLAICTANLPDPAVTPSEHFNTILYDDGAGAKTGVGFQPDMVWLKSRGSTYEHKLTDAVRGVTKALEPDTIALEATDSTGLTAFGADGFTVGADTDYSDTTGDGMVAWCWKAATTASGTTGGSGTGKSYSAQYNTDAGFSIISYEGNGTAGHEIPHHLSAALECWIVKRRPDNHAWIVGHTGLALDYETDYIVLNTTGVVLDSDDVWNDTEPTSSVFTTGGGSDCNGDTVDYIAYCFHSVDGYSKIDSYKGNDDSTDGTMAHCGFRPAWVMIKTTDTGGWNIFDSTRSTYNEMGHILAAHEENAESSADSLDFLSNGFKIMTSSGDMNTSNEPYIYIAFAETPFKYANAR